MNDRDTQEENEVKRHTIPTWMTAAGLCIGLLAAAAAQAQETSGAAEASGAHNWLQQLAGEWQTRTETYLAPGQPPLESSGTESIRRLGDSWVISEIESDFMGMPFSALFTLGYDPQTGAFVGTWVDSVSSYLWRFEGALSADGKTLTLEKEGPCVRTPGKHARYREVMEIHGGDERTFSSHALIEGSWEPMVTIHSRRKN